MKYIALWFGLTAVESMRQLFRKNPDKIAAISSALDYALAIWCMYLFFISPVGSTDGS